MGRSYDQLSLDDRCEIARLSANGSSVRQIAAALDRSPSTISRELKRNSGAQVGYRSSYANQQARARRWKGSRLERDESLRAAVIERLASGWSPEQIAGRLEREQGRKVISYETIYRFIYAQLSRTRDYRWRRYLPRGKSKRGCRGRKGGSPASFIEGRVSLANRPLEAADRSTCGHWEADLMMFTKYGQAILTVHERKSRLLLAIRLSSKAANGVARHLVNLFGAMPPPLRQTVTFDNGTEFARHLALHDLKIETFFCDPYAPWQKGGIENAIGRMRRFIPRKTDLATLSNSRFRNLVAAYNNTPRKCLDFRTPAESFAQLLHFECESTSRLSPGRRRVCYVRSKRKESPMSWQPSNDPVLGDPMSCDALDLVIVPRTRDLGDGFAVRRALPHGKRQMVGPFIFFDHFGPMQFLAGKGMDVRPHPHIGLATVTYLFDGSIMHRDSEGNIQEIQPGAMNLMTAGRGIAHSERTPDVQRRDGQKMLGLQSWIALPAGSEEIAPSFQHYAAGDLPMIAERGFTARVIAGNSFGIASPVAMVSPWFYTEIAADRAPACRWIPITRSARSMWSTARSRSPTNATRDRGC